MSFLIDLKNVTKIFNLNGSPVSVLNNIQLEIKSGEVLAIMGESGSGKSTLMNILGLLDRCTTGDYYFFGQSVATLTPNELAKIRNRQIGFIFQAFHLLPRITALQNVMLPLFYQEMSEDEAREKARLALEKVNMASFAHYKPNQLSGGQQQRIAIARALVTNPDVILADEPTGALDSKTSHDILELLTSLNHQYNKTIVIITHDATVSNRCQRIVTIQDGRIQG